MRLLCFRDSAASILTANKKNEMSNHNILASFLMVSEQTPQTSVTYLSQTEINLGSSTLTHERQLTLDLSLTCQTEVPGPSVLTPLRTHTRICRTCHSVSTMTTVKRTVRAPLVRYTF